MHSKNLIFILLSSMIFSLVFSQQPSGQQYRRNAIHNGNLVRTVFGNWGVVAQPSNQGPRGAWTHDNNGYVGDVSLLVGVEVQDTTEDGSPITFHSVVVCPVDRPVQGGMEESPITGKRWGFEPEAGYFNEYQEYIAMSTNPNSWPENWPDKPMDWGHNWNGFFGKDVQYIQQESYFVMNDNNDEEFNFSDNNEFGVSFKPDSTNDAVNGLGLEVRVRGMQWQQFMAQDVLFWLYEVKNNSTTDYSKVAFGELVGTYIGVTSTEDRGEYDDDWSFFDVNLDLTYTGDYDNDCSRNPNWVGDVGMVGYAFLESPGNPFDGIDNDGDASEFGYAPVFEESDFDSVLINIGDQVVVINEDYSREVYIVSSEDSVVYTKGANIPIQPGLSYLSEGNIWIDSFGIERVNNNAFDGIDNDLDGLIDENYFVHYRQRRIDQDGTVLFDILNPRAYKNYIEQLGLDNSMIDEMRNNGIDDDNDWDPEFDDVGADGISESGDLGEGDGFPTAGEPNFDQTDPDESDQIGLTSFDYFTPANDFPHKDDEALWDKLAPGFFDVPNSIVNGEPIAGEDGDFIFGSGYFPLRAGETERFSIALIYGEDKQDLLKNKQTVQNIYDQDYRFPPPPTKPTLTAVAGDGQVTLYWDRIAEEEMDPILKKLDFQGYKIYKATDPNFNDVRNVTNADGVVEGYQPIAQFDLNDDISGYFYPEEELFQDSQGFTYNLGSNTGLLHKYIDTDVQNGRTYYYAVVAYDEGDPSELFPSENSKFIQILPNGNILTDKNTVVVTPSGYTAGYELNNDIDIFSSIYNHATGSISIEIIDDTKLTGHDYIIEFLDTSSDTLDNDNDWNPETDDLNLNGQADIGEPNIDFYDVQEFAPITTFYSVLNLEEVQQIIELEDSVAIYLNHDNIYPETFSITNFSGNVVSDENYIIDYQLGKILPTSFGSLGADDLIVYYNYYPIYKDPYIQESPWVLESDDTQVFDGVRLNFENDWIITIPEGNIYWITTDFNGQVEENGDTTFFVNVSTVDYPSSGIYATALPNNYLIEFSDDHAYGQSVDFNLNPVSQTNFKVHDILNSKEVDYIFVEAGTANNEISHLDILYLLEPNEYGNAIYSWAITFTYRQDQIEIQPDISFGNGDSLYLISEKPFRKGDQFQFTTPVPVVNEVFANEQLENIRVVPNPYIAATKFESPLPPGIVSGRGERRIEFQNLPLESLIHIYTARGQHIITLEHDGNLNNGTVVWNLKTKENLDVAYGVYFYVVDSDYGIKKGKLAVIK